MFLKLKISTWVSTQQTNWWCKIFPQPQTFWAAGSDEDHYTMLLPHYKLFLNRCEKLNFFRVSSFSLLGLCRWGLKLHMGIVSQLKILTQFYCFLSCFFLFSFFPFYYLVSMSSLFHFISLEISFLTKKLILEIKRGQRDREKGSERYRESKGER